jgi:transcriptional regulator with XRE-family HTH domain
VDEQALGQQLRALRTAAGRTVASVAADAGLSVPYIANLENGRGNPTVTALSRLSEALGTHLAIAIGPAEAPSATLPASLVRLGRTRRFQQAARVMASHLGREPHELSVQLIGALAGVAQAVGKDLSEADWWRLLDALLLIATLPADA